MSSLEQAVERLEPWVGKKVHIVKEEDGDRDAVDLYLNELDVGENKLPDADGYVAQKALLLKGEGVVIGRRLHHLPQGVYEIPVTGRLEMQEVENGVRIITGRARYTISLSPLAH